MLITALGEPISRCLRGSLIGSSEAAANFCGTLQHTITQLLNRIRDSKPIANELPESLKSFAGKEWRLITNDEKNSLFVIDELCHAILEYYAIDARKYKGKQVAINNYRMIARADLGILLNL